MPIKHATQATTPDDGTSEVGTDEWNDDHTGGAGWNQDVDEDGSSFANFTAGNGTWASNGTVISQTATAASHSRAKYNTKIPYGLPTIYECEVQIVDEYGSGDHSAGPLIGYDGATGTGGLAVQINRNDQTIQVERAGVAVLAAPAFTVAADTWYKIRAIVSGPWVSVYIDGTLLGSFNVDAVAGGNNAAFVGLITYACGAEFRNIKLWTLSEGIPA